MKTVPPRGVPSLLTGLDERTPGYIGYVYAMVFIWGLGDAVSTFFAAAATGSAAQELNPMVQVMLVHEPILVGLLKAGVVVYTGIVLLECRDVVERVPGWRAWFVAIVGAGWLVVLNNTVVGLVALG